MYLFKIFIFCMLFSALLIPFLMVTPVFSEYTRLLMNYVPASVQSTQPRQATKAIVVLGGGLRKTKSQDVVLNKYTKQRLQTVVKLHREIDLPIIYSGREAKWAKQWFLENKIQANKLILEGKSLNTCENANFTAIKLKEMNINHIYLVTDAYHQPRSKINFARNGIYISPISASLGKHHKRWDTPKLNFDNSRRAIYEIMAILRDKYKPQSIKECLLAPQNKDTPHFSEVNLKQIIVAEPKKISK